MPHLPAAAHRVGSSAVPTPQRIIDGGHPGFSGHPQRTVPVESQIYGMILPRQGFPSPRVVAGASHVDAIRHQRGGGARSNKSCINKRVLQGYSVAQAKKMCSTSRPTRRGRKHGYAGDQWDNCYATCMQTSNPSLCVDVNCTKYLGIPDQTPSSSSRPAAIRGAAIRGAVRRAGKRRVKRKAKKRKAKRMAFAGKSNADAVRLASGGSGVLCRASHRGVAGADVPPAFGTFRDYPGSGQRHDARQRAAGGGRGGMAGSMYPPSYPDYPGNAQRRDASRGRGVRGGMAGYAGHGHDHDHDHHHDHGKSDEPCCDSCKGGGPCEGCDGAGGCGKPNCACNQA